MRTIDADAFRQRMYHEAFETDTDMQRWDSGCWIRYKLFENCLESMPTISPDEVRGEAKVNYEHGDYSCSACGNSARRLSFARKNYCDECGKKLLWEVTDDV